MFFLLLLLNVWVAINSIHQWIISSLERVDLKSRLMTPICPAVHESLDAVKFLNNPAANRKSKKRNKPTIPKKHRILRYILQSFSKF